MKRRWLVGVGAAAMAGGAGLRWCSETGERPYALDEEFWQLRLRNVAGGDLALATLRGRPLLLNFWATWCAPCVREMPSLDRFQRQYAAKGWQVLGLAIDGIAPVLIFSQKVPVGFPLLIAEAQGLALSQRMGNPGGLPFTALFNRQGALLHVKVGETKLDELSAWAEAAA